MMVTMISMMPLHRDWLGYHHNHRHWIWNCLQLKYARARAVIGWNIALDWNFGPNMYFCRILSCLWWSWYDHDGDSESLNWWWPLTRYTDFYNGNCPAGTMCGCEFCTPFIFVIITTITFFLSIMVINFFYQQQPPCHPQGWRGSRYLHQEGRLLDLGTLLKVCKTRLEL